MALLLWSGSYIHIDDVNAAVELLPILSFLRNHKRVCLLSSETPPFIMPKFPPVLIPAAFRNWRHYPKVLFALRVIQFLLALLSLAFFSRYVVSLVVQISSANGATLGIIVASLIYALITTVIICFAPSQSVVSRVMIWILDLAFAVAYLAVVVLTAPGRGMSGNMCAHTISNMKRDDSDDSNGDDHHHHSNSDNNDGQSSIVIGSHQCNLATATFFLALLSLLSYLASAATGGEHPEHVSKAKLPEYRPMQIRMMLEEPWETIRIEGRQA